MQPTLTARTQTSENGTAPRVPLPLGPLPQMPRTRAPRPGSDLDAVLREIPSQQAGTDHDLDPELNLEPGPGIFMGLRVALMFNAGLGVAALLVYEAWAMLAH